jgi:drug/metabolite transporter (DMT)-like permease
VSRRSAIAVVALATLAVGAAAIFARFALASGGALAVACARLTLAAIVLIVLAAARGRLRVIDGRAERSLLFAGALLAVHFATWIASLNYASVAISTLLVCSSPIFTEIYAVARRGRVDPAAATSVLGALAGVAIVVGAPDRTNTPLGIVLALVGAITFGAYLIVVRGVDRRYDTLAVTARTYATAAVLLAIAAAATHDHLPPFGDARAWFGIAAMAFVSQLFGHTALNAGVRVLTATFVSTFTLIEPVIAAILAAWLFGEHVTILTALGALVILASIFIAVRADPDDAAAEPAP